MIRIIMFPMKRNDNEGEVYAAKPSESETVSAERFRRNLMLRVAPESPG